MKTKNNETSEGYIPAFRADRADFSATIIENRYIYVFGGEEVSSYEKLDLLGIGYQDWVYNYANTDPGLNYMKSFISYPIYDNQILLIGSSENGKNIVYDIKTQKFSSYEELPPIDDEFFVNNYIVCEDKLYYFSKNKNILYICDSAESTMKMKVASKFQFIKA